MQARPGINHPAEILRRQTGGEAQAADDEVGLERRLVSYLAVLPAQRVDHVVEARRIGVGQMRERGRAQHRVKAPVLVSEGSRGGVDGGLGHLGSAVMKRADRLAGGRIEALPLNTGVHPLATDPVSRSAFGH